jgi:hypothetical protein
MADELAENEIGVAEGRGRPRRTREEAEQMLSDLTGDRMRLGSNVVVSGSPTSCPACGESDVMWGCDPERPRTQDEIHPLVWHETAGMADSFVCRSCWAGWIETDEPGPVTWVRPYWRLGT